MLKKRVVSKSNILIESSYTINLVAQRVIILAIIEARDQGSMSEISGVHRIQASDYEKHFGCDKTTAYRSLKSACDSLYESEFLWKGIDEKGREKINRSRFVQRASYSEGGGYVEVMFGNDVIPLITRLSQKYTEYELKQIKDLNSSYALRLFEILMQWRSVGKTPQISIEDLRSRLGILEHQYKLMSDFKKRVLNYALNEINENTNITATYEQYKNGRKIAGFTFRFKDKEKINNSLNSKLNTVHSSRMTEKQINTFGSKLAADTQFGSKFAKPGESPAAFENRIKQELTVIKNQELWAKDLARVGFKNLNSQ